MRIREIGTENEKKLLFLPALSEFSWYENTLKLLSKCWHIYYVEYDGFYEPFENSFESIEKTVREITKYFKERKITKFDMVYGLCMGGAIANVIYAKNEFKIEKLVIDAGLAPYQLPRILTRLILIRDILGILIVRKFKFIIKMVFKPERWLTLEEDKEEFYDEIHQFFNNISLKTVKNVFDSANNYKMPKDLPKTDTKIHYIFGELEKKDRAWDIKHYKKIYPKAFFKEIEDKEHTEFCFVHSKEFVNLLNSF